MRLFAKLRAAREFERLHMEALNRLEDFDLVREIGFHQEQGAPLTMKKLYLLDLGSVATIQRRLRRLRKLGLIDQKRSSDDRRTVELALSPKLLKVFAKYAVILAAAPEQA